MKLQAALIQMKVVEGKGNNLGTAERMLKQAASEGARLLVLPEMFNVPYDNSFFPEYAEDYPGETTEFLRSMAMELDVYIAGGSIPEREGDRIYNTSYIFSPQGELIGRHRKAHLFDIDVKGGITFKESDVLSPGNESTIFHVDGVKVGLIICYDVRFPEFTRNWPLRELRWFLFRRPSTWLQDRPTGIFLQGQGLWIIRSTCLCAHSQGIWTVPTRPMDTPWRQDLGET